MEQRIEKLTAETINSFDRAKRAEPKAFLLTRIYARMQSQAGLQNNWMKAGLFLSRPRVALAALAAIIILNTAIIGNYSNSNNNTVQNPGAKDEFAINVISIYDFENQEP